MSKLSYVDESIDSPWHTYLAQVDRVVQIGSHRSVGRRSVDRGRQIRPGHPQVMHEGAGPELGKGRLQERVRTGTAENRQSDQHCQTFPGTAHLQTPSLSLRLGGARSAARQVSRWKWGREYRGRGRN